MDKRVVCEVTPATLACVVLGAVWTYAPTITIFTLAALVFLVGEYPLNATSIFTSLQKPLLTISVETSPRVDDIIYDFSLKSRGRSRHRKKDNKTTLKGDRRIDQPGKNFNTSISNYETTSDRLHKPPQTMATIEERREEENDVGCSALRLRPDQSHYDTPVPCVCIRNVVTTDKDAFSPRTRCPDLSSGVSNEVYWKTTERPIANSMFETGKHCAILPHPHRDKILERSTTNQARTPIYANLKNNTAPALFPEPVYLNMKEESLTIIEPIYEEMSSLIDPSTFEPKDFEIDAAIVRDTRSHKKAIKRFFNRVCESFLGFGIKRKL
nr:MAG: hypothetical protein [Metapenaeus ensis nimavirus]